MNIGVPLGILALGGLVVVHEMGHMLMARALGVRVRHFCLGIGSGPVRRLSWTSRRSGTTYGIAPLPLGGMVSLEGERYPKDGEHVSGDPHDSNFYTKPYWKKALILVAGSAANLAVGWAVLLVLALTIVRVPDAAPRVGYVAPASAAATAGLAEGDAVTAYRDTAGEWQDVESFEDIGAAHAAGATEFRVKRGAGGEDTVSLPPASAKPNLGVGQSLRRPSTAEAVEGSNRTYGDILSVMWEGYGTLSEGTSASDIADSVTGPVGIVALAGRYLDDPGSTLGIEESPGMPAARVRQAGIQAFGLVWALIAINLGLVNLLPLPPLDGGKLWEEALAPLIRRHAGLRKGIRYATLGTTVLLLGGSVAVTVAEAARMALG